MKHSNITLHPFTYTYILHTATISYIYTVDCLLQILLYLFDPDLWLTHWL